MSKLFLLVKSSFIYLVLEILISCFLTQAYASIWSKYPTNPIFTGESTWGVTYASDSQIMKVNNGYQMWYKGNNGQGWRIGYASSSDGIHNWTPYPSDVIPVGTPDGWEKEVIEHTVLYDQNSQIYKMWYVSSNTDHITAGQDRFRVRYATSLDGITWNIHPGWVMQGTPGKWDEGGITRGISVIKVNGLYHMWYTATNSNDLTVNPYWRIGYATSTDGINWAKQNNNNPVIEPTQSWEGINVSFPSVIFENNSFKMWYSASFLGDTPKQIVYATSLDGINWTKSALENPVITPSPGFDSIYSANPFVMKDGNVYKMWYTGYNGQAVSIGLATMNQPSSSLPVPLLKQTSDPWQGHEYDSAHLWAPSNPTIHDWGCALTSASMVLQYNGITKMPDDTDLNPDSLNSWLRIQPDGYVGNGLVNWLAVARLSRLAKVHNPVSFDALMYQPVRTTDKNVLTNDVLNNIPDILQEPGHFIVATGTQGTTFTINDPYYNRITLNDYGNTFLTLGHYIPSHTDLSYILLAAPTNVTITVKDAQNNSIGESFIQQINNDTTNEQGTPLQTFYVATPSAGLYHIDLSSSTPTPYTLQTFLYDVDGNVKLATFSGSVTSNLSSDLFVNFNKNDSNSSLIQQVSFSTTIADVMYYQEHKEIFFGIGQALLSLLQSADKDATKGRDTVAKIKLNTVVSLLNLLNTFRRNGISEGAYQTLLLDLNYLKNNL